MRKNIEWSLKFNVTTFNEVSVQHWHDKKIGSLQMLAGFVINYDFYVYNTNKQSPCPLGKTLPKIGTY